MKIAIISEHASPLATIGAIDAGGQNIAVAALAQHLAALGYEVDVFTRSDSRRLPAIVEWQKLVRVIHVKAGPQIHIPKENLLEHMPEFTSKMLTLMKENGPYGLTHAHFWMSALVAADIKKATGTPFVVTFHALGEIRRLYQAASDHSPHERFAAEYRAVHEADQIVALCPQDQEDLIQYYSADPSNITIIPNGVDTAEFYPVGRAAARSELGLDAAEPIILQLGRLVPRKGTGNVIEALGVLRREFGTAAHLLVVGGDSPDPDPVVTPEIGRLRSLAERAGVADLVTFVGSRSQDRLRYYFSAADVFVTTPWYEPFGITPLEAMACATPVVASRVGGLKSTILPGHNGYLVPPKDPASLAAATYKLLSSLNLRRRLGNNGLRDVKARFTWGRVAKVTAKMYESVIRAHAKTPA